MAWARADWGVLRSRAYGAGGQVRYAWPESDIGQGGGAADLALAGVNATLGEGLQALALRQIADDTLELRELRLELRERKVRGGESRSRS